MRYKVVLILIALLMFGGFSNLRELNDLAVVSAIGVDKIDDGKYIITTQITNSAKQGGSKSSEVSDSGEVVVYESEDSTIQQALRNMILESPKKLYLAHMEVLLVSENVAKEDFISAIDFFIRDNEGSNDFMLVITKDTTPQEILRTLTPLETNPVLNIKDSIIVTSKYQGTTTNKVLNESLSDILKIGEDITVATVSINKVDKKDDKASESNDKSGEEKIEKKSSIVVSSMAYFSGEHMKGYLEKDDNVSYNIMKNKVNTYILTLETDPKKKLVAEITKNKTKLTPRYENGKYIVDVNIDCVSNITEIGKEVKLESGKDLEKYENLIGEHIKIKLQEYIHNCQNLYKADILGYGNLFYKKLNKEYKKMEANFMTDYFPYIETNINIKVRFPNEGGIVKKW